MVEKWPILFDVLDALFVSLSPADDLLFGVKGSDVTCQALANVEIFESDELRNFFFILLLMQRHLTPLVSPRGLVRFSLHVNYTPTQGFGVWGLGFGVWGL